MEVYTLRDTVYEAPRDKRNYTRHLAVAGLAVSLVLTTGCGAAQEVGDNIGELVGRLQDSTKADACNTGGERNEDCESGYES